MKSIRIDKRNYIEYTNELGQYHREDGPAIEYISGPIKEYKSWHINGKVHREDGPAVEYPNGRKIWYINDKLHRLDGPAIECPEGDKYWYFQGKQINCKTQEEFERLIKLAILW